MKFLKLIKYFSIIKLYFNKLPNDIQSELIDTLENYKDLCLIARYVDFKKGDF